MLVETLEREPPVAPRRAGGHCHRDEDHLADLLVRGARLPGPVGVRIDAPGALRDVPDAERDELLRLQRQRSGLERLAVEFEPRPERLGRELAHPLELLLHVDAVEDHGRVSFRVEGPLLYTTGRAVA